MRTILIAMQLALTLFVAPILAADAPGDIAGYGKTVWGMTEDEVLNAESPRAERLDKPERTASGDIRSITIKEIEIGVSKFRAIFIFDYKTRNLKQVTLESFEKTNPGIISQTFSSIEKLLTEKYGEPTYKQEGTTVSWKLPKTIIQLLKINIPGIWTQVAVIYKPAGASVDASKNL